MYDDNGDCKHDRDEQLMLLIHQVSFYSYILPDLYTATHTHARTHAHTHTHGSVHHDNQKLLHVAIVKLRVNCLKTICRYLI